jgi:hypothetical protein
MADSDKELLSEIKRLRTEVQQLREVVNTLVNMVMEFEETDDDMEPPVRPPQDNFSIYN